MSMANQDETTRDGRESGEAAPAASAGGADANATALVSTSTTATATPAPPTDVQWFVVHTYSGYEKKVQDNLKRRVSSMDMSERIFEVVVPEEEEVEVKDGQRRTVKRKMYPGYVMVQMKVDNEKKIDHEAWYVVRNTPGVTGFVGSKDEPVALLQSEVDQILKQMRTEAPKVRVTFTPNERVRVIDGPFTDFIGVVDHVNQEKGKVTVLVSFFGRETPLELDFLQVEKL